MAISNKRDRKIVIVDNGDPNIFLPFDAEKAKFGERVDVEKYVRQENASSEECRLDDFDSEFQALSNNHRKVNNRFNENASTVLVTEWSKGSTTFSREKALASITVGPKHGLSDALVGVDHVIQHLENNQKLLIMYDIACACRETLNKAFPQLQGERDVWYAVSVFHAFAHSAACQAKNNPRYVDHPQGLTDGEGAGKSITIQRHYYRRLMAFQERFWSFANHFVSQVRSMTKANRRAMLTELADVYCDEKMKGLPNLIAKKYEKAIEQIQKLNMTKSKFEEFERAWQDHKTALAIPFSQVKNYKKLKERAEANLLNMNSIHHSFVVPPFYVFSV
ncbi:hypothetical protein MBANPS3_001917 [Mucor bainieri]